MVECDACKKEIDEDWVLCGACAEKPSQHIKDKRLDLALEVIKELKKSNDVAKNALYELGHHGIDFGYGKHECEVAKVAQQSHEVIRQTQEAIKDKLKQLGVE